MCKTPEDDTIYFHFSAVNDVPIEDFSFSAALESMLLGMDPAIVCTGDSCPNIDFQVQFNIPEDMLEKKLEIFTDRLIYIKADTTTEFAVTLPDSVVNLAIDYAELDDAMPA